MATIKQVYEEKTELQIYAQVDVLVIGGGVAGFGAAVAAARAGAKTLLLEYSNSIGGMSTTGMMSHFTGTVNSSLYREVLERMARKRKNHSAFSGDHYIEPEALKAVYLEMLDESGVETLLYTQACRPILEGNQITGVVIENKSGRQVIWSKVSIDATGDGDIAARSGIPYVVGREEDARMQPATLMFKVGGVDKERAVFPGSFETLVETDKGELQQLAQELLPEPAGHVLLYNNPLPGLVTVNMTNIINIDGTDARSLTEAERVARKQIPVIVDFLRAYVPGYENCYVVSSAAMMGVRETRHFEGVYTLTKEDIMEKQSFDDWIVRDAEFNFDVHNLSGGGLDKSGLQHGFPPNTSYQIPYRCCLPVQYEGLLFSGRLISGTHMAHSNFRAMPICMAIGEGTGYAAAVASRLDIRLREVDIRRVQELIQR